MITNLSEKGFVESLVELATSHHQHGRFEQAFETFFQVAELYRMQDKHELAAQTFRKLLRLETSDIELQLALVQNFLELELHEEAAEAFCLCASHFDTLGMLDRFLELANQLLHIDPDLMEVRNKVIDVLLRDTEIYLSYKLFDQAKLALERALEHFPYSIRIHKMMLELIKKTSENREQIPWLLKLAELTCDDTRTSSQYLSCALTLTDNPEEIFRFADSINVVLRPSSSATTSIGDEVTESTQQLSTIKNDEEENTPRPRLSLRQRLTQKLNPVVPAAQHELVMLQQLLRIAEQCKEPTILSIRATQSDTGPYAELLACDGALSVNIRLNDETLSSQPLKSSANRDDLRQFITEALLTIARAFQGVTFDIQQTATDQEVSLSNLVPSFSILMALARNFAENPENNVAASFFDAASSLAEQGWLFMNPPPGISFPLPIASVLNSDTNFARIDDFGRTLFARQSFLKKLFAEKDEQPSQRPVLTQLIVADTSYACLSCPGYSVILQVEHKKIGQLFQLARQFIGNQDP